MIVGNEKSEFKIIDITSTKYIKPYQNLTQGFFHTGNMLFLQAHKGERLNELANKSIKYTHFYKSYKLKNAIIKYNGLSNNILAEDMFLYIPYSLPSLIPDIKNHKKPEIINLKGLYFSGISIGSDNFLNTIARYKDVGINAVVFDAKDITGDVTYLSHVPDVVEFDTHAKHTIDNIDRMIWKLKESGIYTIARIAVFRDHLLYSKNHGFAIRSKKTGNVWNPDSVELWCDPTNKYVQDYNIHLAIELAEKGVDEIQFDYVRFPTTGAINDADYIYHYGKMSKEAVIAHFLKRAYNEISGRNARLSIDIFGVIAWSKKEDIEKTGQKIEILSNYCDIISPMLYPSHFNDYFDGFANPGDEPYHFIYNGCIKTNLLAGKKPIRPWLQAFGWRVTNFNEDYIIKQVRASNDAGTYGYLFWNSTNNYDNVFKALSKLALMDKKQNPPR